MRPHVRHTLAILLTLSATLLPWPGHGADVRSDMLVTTDWLAEHLDDPGLVVVHVAGERAGYEKGHVPGARFLAWEAISIVRDGIPNEFPETEELAETFAGMGLEPGQRIVLYDESQGIPAARAFIALDLAGLGSEAALLDGHLGKWQAEGRALSSAEPTPAPRASTATPRPRSEVIVPLEEMASLYAKPAGAAPSLVDSRPASHYSGEEPGRGITRGGHIPGAVHVYWKDHLADAEVPVLRAAEELLELYEAAGVEVGRQVVTYCRSGGQASHTYFTLKYLGFDVRMYDGSFLEWSAAPERPVATPDGGPPP